jgi:AcrR family transcriptional regulator
MTTETLSTEDLILVAARKVFSRHGLQGARMQDIADEAGINKALLHYYFRSKEKLFEIVFREAFGKFSRNMNEFMLTEASFEAKIDSFIENYIDLLLENPYLPGFIIGELNSQPGRLLEFISTSGLPLDSFLRQVEAEVASGRIREINGKHLLVNIISLCVFPFLGKPVLTGILFGHDDQAFRTFLKERKLVVKSFIHASLKP